MGEPEGARKDPTLSALTTRRLGRYELLTQIGKGGMAEVHLAMQRGPAGFEKLIVIKLVHEHLASTDAFVEMLLEEGRLAGMIKHPNVVDIYDLGEADGRFYVAMEYLDGEPLLAILRKGVEGSRLDPLSTARVISDAAEGLEAAHRLKSLDGKPLGVIHHDVSLGNIVVLYNGTVKLVDFGVAKARNKSSGGMIQGKFGYMAPEKLTEGAEVDRRSDIWSLGVVAWEALTLQRLFKAPSDPEVVQQVLELEIPPPSVANPGVPKEFDPIIMHALERDPEKRTSTAKGLALDLEAVLRKRGYAGKNDRIAGYMETTFAKQIAVRERLVAELSAGKTTIQAREALAAFKAAAQPITKSGATPAPGVPVVGDQVPSSRIESPVTSSNGIPRTSETDLRRGEPIPGWSDDAPAPATEQRRDSIADVQQWLDDEHKRRALGWKRYAPFAAGGCVILLLIIVLASRCGGGKPAALDASQIATTPPQASSIDAMPADSWVPIDERVDAIVMAEPPDAAVVAPPVIDAGVPTTPKPGPGSATRPKPGAGSATKPGPGSSAKPKPADPGVRPSGADGLYRNGMDQLRRGDARGALSSFEAATKANSSYANAWYGIGRAQEALGTRKGPIKSAYLRYLSLAPSGEHAAEVRQRIEHL